MQRKSNKREKILELFKREHLLSAHQCYKKLDNIDLATIYRNIKQLLDAGILKEVHINKQESYFELNQNDHQHLICKACGHIESINIPSENLNSVINPAGFKIEKLELNIRGICPKCYK